MSYILDALKKSEQERGQGNIPGVQTVHSSSLSYHNEKSSYWPYILITAVIINIALVLYFILDKEPSVKNQTEVAGHAVIKDVHDENTIDDNTAHTAFKDKTEQSTIKTSTTDEQTEPASFKTAPATTHAQAQKQTAAAATESHSEASSGAPELTTTGSDSTEDDTTVIDFYDLPDSVKQQLPAIIISAHVYSSNPLQRSIVINNNFMEEGEYVLDNLRLYEITSGGAIFDYNGTRFSYSVISSWQ